MGGRGKGTGNVKGLGVGVRGERKDQGALGSRKGGKWEEEAARMGS
jgi:hypothetical protein